MPINDPDPYTCKNCKHYTDTPNHYFACETPERAKPPLTQIPKVDPEENWQYYKDDLTRYDGELDLQRVKEFAAAYEWASQNNAALLNADLQWNFSKPHTHASWVADAIRRSFHDEKMYEVEELIDILEHGGFEEDETLIDTVKNYFEYEKWKKENP